MNSILYKILGLFLIALLPCSLAFGQKGKLSPFVREAMHSGNALHGQSLAKGKLRTDNEPMLTAFVRTSDANTLTDEGCKVYAQWDDICIAAIPIDKISTLAAMPEIKRIEAGRSCFVTNDTSATITRTREVWNTDIPELASGVSSIKGSGVVVGVMDIGFDLTHPTFYSADGKTYRIKQFWDQLDQTDGGLPVEGKDTIYVGRQYIGEAALLALQHSYDGCTQTHGTHTTGTAAGSGWQGMETQGVKTYSGMAPEADICLVCNAAGDNSDLIPEEEEYKYTTATDMLGFKYIFDYATKVGKPCVINFSEGAPDDLYESGIYQEVLSKLVGPGRIICSSAGNNGNSGTYMHKAEEEASKSAFLARWAGNTATYVLRSKKPVKMSLLFWESDVKKDQYDYDLTGLAEFPDSLMEDTVYLKSDTIIVAFMTYPSCFDESLYATDLFLVDKTNKNFGYAEPVSMTLLGEDNDIEAFSYTGAFVNNSYGPSFADFESSHSVFFPGSAKDIISVGATSHVNSVYNYKGKDVGVSWGNEGKRAGFSAVGPAITGLTKPDVVAPGVNVVSAYNSFYREKNPDSSEMTSDILQTEYNGRTYPWTIEIGTSMASPIVTGIVALWLQVCPTLTPDQVKDVIAHTSTHPDDTMEYPNNYYGYGLIDAMAGLDYIRQVYTGITEHQNSSTKLSKVYTIDGKAIDTIGNQHGIFIISEGGIIKKVVR